MSITIQNSLQALGYNLSKVVLTNINGATPGAFSLIGVNGATTASVTPETFTTGATLPSPVVQPAGGLFFDTANETLYVSTGTAYEVVLSDAALSAVVPMVSSFPSSPSVGQFAYLTVASGSDQVGLYVWGHEKHDDVIHWVNLYNTNGIDLVTGKIPVGHGKTFPSVAPNVEFPEDRGTNIGLVGSVFKLTADFEQHPAGLYYNAGTYITGSIEWLPVTNLTPATTYFATGIQIGSKLPEAGDFSTIKYSPTVVLTEGKLFYKNGTDVHGVEGLYVIVSGVWTLASL